MHILIIGGTGMLWEASQYFAQKENYTVTNISRKAISSTTINSITCDYSETEKFIQTVEAINHDTKIDKLIVWMHSHAKDSCTQLFEFVVKNNIPFYHLLGSIAYSPDTTNQFWSSWQETTIYKQILLGFQVKNEQSRWLSHQEISQGTIEAIEKNQDQIIGQISPWEMRP